MEKTPSVSVLICTRDRCEPVVRCIRSILEQDYPNFEILILDDFSEHGDVCNFIRSRVFDPRVKCFRSDKQLGVAGARNFLMRQATGKIFVVIDDDAVFAGKNCLFSIVDILNKNLDVGILALRIVDHRGGREELMCRLASS